MKREALLFAAGALGAAPGEPEEIEELKCGMTNRSYLLACREKRYILRVPGEGTDRLINRGLFRF